MPNDSQIDDFLHTLRSYYDDFGRHDMLWRSPDDNGSFDPYKIMVSELMLQQTQVARVTPKCVQFLHAFPTAAALAAAPLGDVLTLWSGLGYNRRAKFLWQAAQRVTSGAAGQETSNSTALSNAEKSPFPRTLEGLVALPGVGPNTAGAILSYAYNEPAVFVETNVRTVLIHHFFRNQIGIADAEIRAVLKMILGHLQPVFTPREFYWAVMDYGTHLKQTIGNLNRASNTYSRQSSFHGSRRQLRGAVIRTLTEGTMLHGTLVSMLGDDRATAVIQDLVTEGLITRTGDSMSLS